QRRPLASPFCFSAKATERSPSRRFPTTQASAISAIFQILLQQAGRYRPTAALNAALDETDSIEASSSSSAMGVGTAPWQDQPRVLMPRSQKHSSCFATSAKVRLSALTLTFSLW